MACSGLPAVQQASATPYRGWQVNLSIYQLPLVLQLNKQVTDYEEVRTCKIDYSLEEENKASRFLPRSCSAFSCRNGL
jgi:hypothetical protein